MSDWTVKKHFKTLPKLHDPIAVEGLPGIGNVGKIAVDFMIDELKPTLLYTIYSYSFPNSVFISENNLIELPVVNVLLYKRAKKDIVLISGDVQPTDERSSYLFAEKMIDLIKELGCKEIITLGGIGRPGTVKSPKVYTTATDTKTLRKYGKYAIDKISGVVSNIVGATGLLLGLAQMKGLSGAALLVDTYGHPLHLGISESKGLLTVLNEILGLKLDLKRVDEEIEESKAQMEAYKKNEERRSIVRFRKQLKEYGGDTSYIG